LLILYRTVPAEPSFYQINLVLIYKEVPAKSKLAEIPFLFPSWLELDILPA